MTDKNIIESQEPKKDYKIPDDRSETHPTPQTESDTYKPAGKMKGMNAIVTGADSGIGRATAIAFSKEGANVAVVDLEDKEDIHTVKERIEEWGVKALTFTGDVGDESFAQEVVEKVASEWGDIHTLVNNAAEQHSQEKIGNITSAQLDRTFRTNVYGMFYFTKAAFPHMPEYGTVINTTSVTAYKGSPGLMDYAATKGAIVAFTRSFAQNKEVTEKNIRVNAVAPGPIWAPLIPATIGTEYEEHGKDVPLGRPGEPYELAPAYVYLATSDSSYVTGQVIHINGGTIVNG